MRFKGSNINTGENLSKKSYINIESSMIATITGDLAPVAQDLAEITFDSVLKEGVLKEIPIIGFLVSLWKTQANVREILYLKKLSSFLTPLSKISINERQLFIENTLKTDKSKEQFGEAILHLIERANSSEKTELYGRFFLAHIKGEYKYEEVLKICTMIDSAYLPELRKLILFMNTETEDVLLTSELYRSGFLTLAGLDGGSFTTQNTGGPVYIINWYGEQLVHIFKLIDEEI
jgi:hypothetical protein